MDGCEAITCRFFEAKLLSSGFVSSPKPRVPEDGIESDEQAFTLPINFRLPSHFTLKYLISAMNTPV